MPRRVEILKRETAFQESFFRIERAELRHEQHDGSMSAAMTRLSFERGDGVAGLLLDSTTQSVLLIEQFRYPTHRHGDGWLLELPAGILNADETPVEAMRREWLEEVGYQVAEVQTLPTFYVSPGGSSERIHLFFGEVTPADQQTAGGGRPEEQEDIRSVWLSLAAVTQGLQEGTICDAKTIIALQWLLLNK